MVLVRGGALEARGEIVRELRNFAFPEWPTLCMTQDDRGEGDSQEQHKDNSCEESEYVPDTRQVPVHSY